MRSIWRRGAFDFKEVADGSFVEVEVQASGGRNVTETGAEFLVAETGVKAEALKLGDPIARGSDGRFPFEFDLVAGNEPSRSRGFWR